MSGLQNPRVTQGDEEWAEEVASAANIVTNGGYYEIDIDAVTLVIARHREAAEAASKAREAALVEALEAIRKTMDGYRSQMKFCDVEALSYFREFDRRIEASGFRAALTSKEPGA